MTAAETPTSGMAENSVDTGPQPGERLRQARESLGLSLEDIAAHLHLGVDKIAALERSETEGIAAPVFLAGYLRAYAKKVGLSGDEIVAAYDALSSLEAPTIEPSMEDFGHVQSRGPSFSSSAGLGQWLSWGVLGLVIIGGVVLGWNMLGDEPRAVAPARERLKTPQVTAPNKEEGVASALPEAAETSAVETAAAPLEAQEPEAEVLAPRVQLMLHYREDSWTEIQDAQGNRLLHRLGKAGDEYSVKGVAPFEIVLGFAPGVDLQYNGEPYDLSRYKNRRLVRFSVGKQGDDENPVQ